LTSLRAAAKAARDRLLAAGVAENEVEAEIEAEVLLRFAIEPDAFPSKAYLYARFEDEVAPDIATRYDAALRRRLAHEPTAYITGRREFYGLEFRVTHDVLIPRPETEMLVEAAIKLADVGPACTRLRIADIGTGSGALAVALAKTLPRAEIYATDVSGAALKIATGNAKRHDVDRRIAFRHGHLLTPVHHYVDLIVANLPYVTTGDWSQLPPELREHEPRMALDGGADGLDLIRALLRQAARYLHPGGRVVLEIGEGQIDALEAFIEEALPVSTEWSVEEDFAGIPRVITVSFRRRRSIR
jgi:release factor glutamine methyltransferase